MDLKNDEGQPSVVSNRLGQTIVIICPFLFLMFVYTIIFVYTITSIKTAMKKSKKLTLLIIIGVLVTASLVTISLRKRYIEVMQKFDGSICLDSLDIRCKIKNDYMAEYMQTANFGGQVFCAHTVMGSEQVGEIVTEYLWATCGEYLVEDGKLKEESGKSTPVVLTIEKTPDSYRVLKHERLGMGSIYMRNIERMFPEYITERELFFVPSIFERAHSHDNFKVVRALINESERKARVHFGLK